MPKQHRESEWSLNRPYPQLLLFTSIEREQGNGVAGVGVWCMDYVYRGIFCLCAGVVRLGRLMNGHALQIHISTCAPFLSLHPKHSSQNCPLTPLVHLLLWGNNWLELKKVQTQRGCIFFFFFYNCVYITHFCCLLSVPWKDIVVFILDTGSPTVRCICLVMQTWSLSAYRGQSICDVCFWAVWSLVKVPFINSLPGQELFGTEA